MFSLSGLFLSALNGRGKPIKLDNSSIFLESVLKLYFKHFYLKLLNSCLWKNLCPGILKCMYYGVVRLSLAVWSF